MSAGAPAWLNVATFTVVALATLALTNAGAAVERTVACGAQFVLSPLNVTVYVPAAGCATAVAPRCALSAPASETTANLFCARALATISYAFWPSTRSAFRPVATPVALVVNGAAVAGPSMRPTSVPDFVANENARPLARLLARRHARVPVRARQP